MVLLAGEAVFFKLTLDSIVINGKHAKRDTKILYFKKYVFCVSF